VKTIDAVLIDHKNSNATTLCQLLLVGPLGDGTYRGFAGLDVDVVFSPAASIGPITFKTSTGVQMSAIQTSANLAVDNAEAQTLYPVAGYEVDGFTQAQIDSGALDKVPFAVFMVNYNDLTEGRCEILGGGTIGEVRTKVNGLVIVELRSLAQQLKQQIVKLDSIRCRAIFGDAQCGFDTSTLWVAGTIGSVGDEVDREFTDASLIGAGENFYAPGMVRITSGDNVGQMIEVEAFDNATGKVTLRYPVVTSLADGVEYEIRQHCSKRWTGHNSCETFWGTDKPLHFRGEPHIPVGDSGLLNSPGAAI
jgi:uncharacterized phage protein (TIGR02218 family)